MTIKPRSLPLAILAVLVTGALAAPSAQAGEIDIGADPAVITGHSDEVTEGEGFQKHELFFTTTKGSKVSSICPTATLEGTSVEDGSGSQTVTDITATATYTGCTLFGAAATVQMNGCKYTFTGAGQPPNTFLVDIVGCTEGKTIQKRNALCTVDIGEQTGLSHAVFHNDENKPHQVTLETTVTGTEMRQTGALCPDGNNHVTQTAGFTANTTISAYVDNGSTQVTLHGHQYQQAQEGAQTSITST